MNWYFMKGKNVMKRFEKSSELLWIFGILFVALGVSICSKADLGVSMIAAPAFVISEAITPIWSGFSVGVTEYIIQGVMLVILCLVIRKFDWRFLLGFAVAVIYGYTLNFFLWTLDGVSFNTVALRYVMLIVGDIVTATGVACFFRTYMPLQVYELFVAELSFSFKFNINKTKSRFDIALLIISLVLAFTLFGDVTKFDWSSITYKSFHSIGIGTIITTLINSPIIAIMGKLIDKILGREPMYPRLKQVLSRN